MSKTAITNAQVYNHETGEFSSQTILMKDEKIEAIISPTDYIADYSIIDAEGCYVTPGLIDTCSQIGLKETGIRWEGNDGYEPHEEEAQHLQVIDGIYPFDEAFQHAVSSGVTAAHIVSSAESITGAKTVVIHTYGKTADEMILVKNLGYSFSMGDVPKKAFWDATRTPITRMGIAQRIRSTLKCIQAQEDIHSIPFFFRCHRADDIETALRISEEFNLQLTLVHASEYGRVAKDAKNIEYSIISGPCFQPMERGELINLGPSLFSDIANEHRRFTFATDHPVNSVKNLHLEGCLAIKAGVSEKEVLNGLTLYAAEQLKIDKQTGSIQPGLLADLVIWNEHPLSLTARVESTFIKGQKVFERR